MECGSEEVRITTIPENCMQGVSLHTRQYGIDKFCCFSSIGMAKAALEVINGLDLFGSQGSASSTIYVDPDAHNRNRMILGSLLPRESSSKACRYTVNMPAVSMTVCCIGD